MRTGSISISGGRSTNPQRDYPALTSSINYSSAAKSLRKDLTRTYGTLNSSTEQVVLNSIKSLAVRAENILVARVQLGQIRQDRDEPVRAFAARLRGQASVCAFTVECGCNPPAVVSYSGYMVRDALIRGIEDEEIRLDILGQAKQDLTLDEALQFIEARESGKRSALQLNGSSVQAALSTYKRKDKLRVTTPRSGATCGYCGQPGHSQNRQDRINKCPAYGKQCGNCGKYHHLMEVSRQTTQRSTAAPVDNSGMLGVLDAVHSISTSGKISHLVLDHHIYDELCDSWKRKSSHPQPVIDVRVVVHPDDSAALGFSDGNHKVKHCEMQALADTGCQSCLAGTNILRLLGLQQSDIIPVTMQMSAATNQGIKISGAIVARVGGKSAAGSAETRQIIYLTDDTKRLFLSKQACIALGFISKNFPTVGETHSSVCQVTSDSACQCPTRKPPPPVPSEIPFAPVTANRQKLETWLKDRYSSSTFNVCTHQLLPTMSGPPLRLHVNPEATPSCVHTPIPVPLHWQDQVKAALDEDVRLGVIESVAVGEPTRWCHRMVICAKKSGKHRRTVDLQPLNQHASRETHHTQSPFHQARSVPRNTFKTVFDAWNGYHSISLHEGDRHYTTFITPWGRYRYCVAPQGYIASGDGYTRRFDEIVSQVPNKTKCIDDTLLWSSDIAEAFSQAAEWLHLCGRNGIVLNPSKFVFAKETVDFAGFEISNSTVGPCAQYLEAIESFPSPKNITDIRSWFGLVNQISFSFAAAPQMSPFRNLLKPGTPFQWTDHLEQVFQASKNVIINEIRSGVEIFDKGRPTCLATDWSKSGIGFWLTQKHCDCQPIKPLCCASG